MAKDIAVTDRLRQLAEATDGDSSGDTTELELEELDLMATSELRQLLDPEAEPGTSLDDDVVEAPEDSEDASRG